MTSSNVATSVFPQRVFLPLDQLKSVFTFNHLKFSNGHWFRVCGGYCKTLFTLSNNFDHVRARRS